MKKFLFILFVLFPTVFAFCACGQVKTEIEFVDNFRKINVTKITDDNFYLAKKSVDSDSIVFTADKVVPIYFYIKDFKSSTTRLTTISSHLDIYGQYGNGQQLYADYKIIFREVREYEDFVFALYDICITHYLVEAVTDSGIKFDKNFPTDVIFTNQTSLFIKGKDTIRIDSSLYF